MVIVIKSTQELIDFRNKDSNTVAFVPTMGNLHAGHISLLEEALSACPTVYFSIFVNPKQFGPSEDFNKYPRTLENDLVLIGEIAKKYPGKTIVVFAPIDPKEVFPENYDQNISVLGISTILEGEFRPGHFDGVATVVYRLFEIVKPAKAYFGLKDFQQFLVIQQMVKDLQLPIEIIGMPIIREKNGLALSSRNQYLTPIEKEKALILNQSLKNLVQIINGRLENIPKARQHIQHLIQDLKWNYLEIRDAETLSDDLTFSKKLTLLGVYQLSATRLLDNIQVELK
jgi:pantoate--beta-alanine ligase